MSLCNRSVWETAEQTQPTFDSIYWTPAVYGWERRDTPSPASAHCPVGKEAAPWRFPLTLPAFLAHSAEGTSPCAQHPGTPGDTKEQGVVRPQGTHCLREDADKTKPPDRVKECGRAQSGGEEKRGPFECNGRLDSPCGKEHYGKSEEEKAQ